MGVRQEYTEVSALIAATDDRYKKFIVQELRKSYLFYRLMSAGNFMNVYDTKEVPYYIAPPQLGKWIVKGDQLPDAQSQNSVAMGFWTNRYIVVPSGLDQLEMMQKEHDPSQIFDMFDLKAMESAWAMKRALSNAAWNGTGGKQPDGLTSIIEKAAPSSQTAVVGGVDKATKAWFRNQYVQLTSNFGTIGAGTTIPAGILAIMSLIQATTIGTMQPSDLITTKAIFQLVKRSMLEMSTPYHMITERSAASYGIKTFEIDGIRIAWDPHCPADSMYALHLDERMDPSLSNDPKDKTKLDTDLESLGKDKFFDLNGSIAVIQHPNIKNRRIAPRSPLRHLQQVEWYLNSFNLGVARLSDQGVLGDDGGSKLSTWV